MCTLIYISTFVPNLNFGQDEHKRRQVLCLNGSPVPKFLLTLHNEEKSIKAISAQTHGEAADNRLLRKKLREKDELISDLRAQIENLNNNLSEKVSQMADMMDKLVAFMMGRGDVTLSDSLRDAVVSGVRAEYEMRERELKEEFSSQLEKMSAEFETRLAAKDNEINSLR